MKYILKRKREKLARDSNQKNNNSKRNIAISLYL